MNWAKVVFNLAGVASACYGAQAATGMSHGAKELAFGIGMCVAANLTGLFQSAPHTDGK